MSNGPLTVGRIVDISSAAEEVLNLLSANESATAWVDCSAQKNVGLAIQGLSDVGKRHEFVRALRRLYHANEALKSAEMASSK